MKMPKIYHAYKKLRDIWSKSAASNKDEVIKMIDESLEEIVMTTLIEHELLTPTSEDVQFVNTLYKVGNGPVYCAEARKYK